MVIRNICYLWKTERRQKTADSHYAIDRLGIPGNLVHLVTWASMAVTHPRTRKARHAKAPLGKEAPPSQRIMGCS
ncbi:hypothetical protein Y032_0120g918 [Ancylostoma ceylanicum]|uniref:Uncharacterized protein n=1 Tax=Ancylostoma ceylanicum TaxID=53326 RepID=A0A016TAR7_9BILA|nr:hypothetical protein Y032_0120g918 [Ancylostoma ceylanicum]